MQKTRLPAVDAETLRGILEDFEELERFEKGKHRCVVCSRVLVWENTLGVFLDGDKLRFLCDDYRCLDRLREEQPEKIAV